VIVPVGGGGLAAGWDLLKGAEAGSHPDRAEPEGAPSMLAAYEHGKPVTLDSIDRFVDGAAVARSGLTFPICQKVWTNLPIARARSATPSSNFTTKHCRRTAGALSVAALEAASVCLKAKRSSACHGGITI